MEAKQFGKLIEKIFHDVVGILLIMKSIMYRTNKIKWVLKYKLIPLSNN